MERFEQAVSLAARLAVDSVKEQFSPEERMEAVGKLEEEEMLAVLDRVVKENSLSYTESSFRVLKGKGSKPV